MSDTQKHTKPNVPNLRFPEFEGEWDKLKVRDFTKVVAGATPATDKKEYWGGTIRWMNSGELNLKRVYEVQGRITQLGYDRTSTKIIPSHSVLIGLAGQGKTRGTAAMNYVELCTNQSIASILPSDSFYPEFLYQNIESRYKELRDISSGDGGRGGLNLQMIYNLDIPHCSVQEQKKIGDFLYLLDQRIAIQNKIIGRYQSLIRAISKALVVTDGKPIKLGDIAEIYQPRTISVLQMTSKDKYPVYGANGIIGYYSDYNHATEQICIACRGNTCGVVNYSKPFSWITGNSMVINVDQSAKAKLINKRYLFHLLSTVDYTPLISGSGQPQIVRGPLRNMQVVLPCVEKQILVAQLLDAMVERHEMEKEIMSRWVAQKQTLLHQIFI